MGNLLTYSGIITKIKAMASNYITVLDYEKISNLESVPDFFSYLKSHSGYNDIFSGLEENNINRSQIEGIFINGLYKDFTRIYQFADMEQRKALDLIFFRYEIDILKSCLQLAFSHEHNYEIPIFEDFFIKHLSINTNALSNVYSVDEFISALKGSDYYDLFTRLSSSNHISSFDYEIQLDIYYYKKAWKLKDKLLKGDNLKVFTSSLGTEIDLQNIMWLYRSKRFFDMNSNDYYANLIPIYYKLKPDVLKKLVDSSSMDEFKNIILTTPYKDILVSDDIGTMESYLYHLLLKIQKYNSNKYPSSMAPVLYYLNHKSDELNRLTTALECIRYKLDPGVILKYVLQ